jgi:hypothetical protein
MLRITATAERNGQHLWGAARFFCALILLSSASLLSAAEEDLKEIAQLAKSGAPQLALSLLQQGQPEFSKDQTKWMRWERVRVRIMQQRGDWSALAKHLGALPAEVAVDFRRWAQTRRANALIYDNRSKEARQVLRELIWRDTEASSKELAEWRQLVMQSYLHQGRNDDAHAAMLRFHQDYGEGTIDAKLMRVRVLLASKRPLEAASLLKTMPQERTTELLGMLAQLRSSGNSQSVLRKLRKVKKLSDYTPLQSYLHYGIMAEAALGAKAPAFAVIAMEQWFRQPTPVEEWRELFSLTPNMLWDSYLTYAQRLGNDKQLLIGDDMKWYQLAEKTDKRYPVGKRSLYALLARKAFALDIREKAAMQLIKMLQEMSNGMAVVKQLFLNSQYFNEGSTVPPGPAYLLVDQAIREGNLSAASRLMRHLPEPPGDTAKFPWQLRRAKVFILAGDNQAAVSLLRKLMPAVPSLGKEQRDQFMQLLFDLQNVGEYESAYALLDEMYHMVSTLELRREILFWMGDSRLAQHNYVEAAQLYLRSATLSDYESMDPWAQTARYKAASTLAEGGMLADAAHIYSHLLRVTENPERRAVLIRELEQIRMREAAAEKRQ